jgi:tRNA modification GTPase
MSGPRRSSLETEQKSVVIARNPKPDGAAAFGDTIAAIATAPGRSAVATIRVSGGAAFAIGAACITPWPIAPRRATLVVVRAHDTGETIDRVLATTYPAPRSFTGEDVLEVSTHGGAIVPASVLRVFVRAGARPAEPGEFTRRALLLGKIDLIQAEALGDLIDAPTSFVRRAALDQLSGVLTRRIDAIREALLELEALLAYDIDFPEEDEGPVAPARIFDAAAQARAEVDMLLRTLPAARIAREGAVVVLAGLPNTGKSSLFNALIGEQRAIVTEHAGTTRDAIDALIESEPYAFRLIDTAGLRETTDAIERLGVEVSTRWLGRADVVLVCGPSEASRRATVESIGATGASLIRVRTMCDLTPDTGNDTDVAVSAHTGEGLELLRVLISEKLLARYPLPAAETPIILRARHETALLAARDELDAFSGAWREGRLPPTVAAIHVRAAVDALDGLIGATDIEDVLSRLFERFCVGK